MNISAHITLTEATFSQSAVDNKIDNTPTAEHLEAMKYVAEHFSSVLGHTLESQFVSTHFTVAKK